MPDSPKVPEGVKRWRSGTEVVESSTPTPRKLEVTRMFESEDGEWIDIYDLPAIVAANAKFAEQEVRERLESDEAVLIIAASLAATSVDRFRKELAAESPKDGILGRREAEMNGARIKMHRWVDSIFGEAEPVEPDPEPSDLRREREDERALAEDMHEERRRG
jgi:hypothetical protein